MTLDDLNAALAAEDARSRDVRLRLFRAKLDQQVLAFDLVGAAETERAIMRLEKEGVNAYIRSLVALGALIGGRCWADPDLNSPANIAQGKVYFSFEFTSPYPVEHITFNSILTTDFFEELV